MTERVKQCKEMTTRYDGRVGDHLVLRCQLRRGHAGPHIALSTNDNAYALTKWSYTAGAAASPQGGASE